MIKSLSLFLFILIAKANADCQLSVTDISETNRIFGARSGTQLDPLRVDVVPSGQALDMICNSQNVVITTCQQNQFEPKLPMKDCSNPIKAIVEEITDNSCAYTMYRVGYKVSEDEFLELYRSCYDPSTQTAHFVIYEAYSHNLGGERPGQSFTTDRVISGAAAASFEAKNIYKRFEELLGPNQPYISSQRDLVFDRGHLAPSADFGFDQYMRMTFKYINAVAQFAGINRGNWKTIENWVRKELSSDNLHVLKICVGAFGVLELANTEGQLKEVYLYGETGNPVPKWMYKIVSDDAGSAYAFLTYNNIHDPEEPTPNCIQVPCPASLTFNTDRRSGPSFCCDPSDFVIRNAPQLANVC